MSLILLIETATTSCSVALAKDDHIIALREVDQRNIHAEVITVFIDELFKQTNHTYAQLDAVAVSSGPGSYTGLRIGVSTAKGLCFSLDKPLIVVETLQAMAHGFIARGGMEIATGALLCPMIDARRMEVYTALFDDKGNEVKPTTAEIIDSESFANVLIDKRVIFFGDGAAKCKAAFADKPNAIIADSFVNSATDILVPALEKLNKHAFADVAYFEPYYLKDFIAGVKKQ
jgi:tRNA threonylcarbamoyladenosine biosynthesis protein TsaB